ncbi:hypothetical protein LAZ67_1002001 [Cordylochernes scorpioides]|uniref:Uncharacterized protein n=1 Tax=Cordylochernes scorpioides TaxID=51811 RepID=A0ABY6JYK4_9ARAC|nr:hypothetical protein LAZ67_1002001 [Cordylochernes scorpioides]
METSEALHWTRQQQQKIDMDPEQQLYTPKIENIAAAVIEIASDVSMHLYHRSSNVLYLGCVKLLLLCPMKSLRCLHVSLSQHQQCPLSWVCKVAVLGPCQFSVTVVSNEEPQMSLYISITVCPLSWVCKADALGPCQFSERLRPLLDMRICE